MEYAIKFSDSQFPGKMTMDTEFMLKGVPQETILEITITPIVLVPLPGLTGPSMSHQFTISKCLFTKLTQWHLHALHAYVYFGCI